MLDIDLIEARANAATPGPWSEAWDGEIHAANEDWELVMLVPEGDDRPADCAFVANAREDVPALIAEVRQLRTVAEASVKRYDAEERVGVTSYTFEHRAAWDDLIVAMRRWGDAVAAYKRAQDEALLSDAHECAIASEDVLGRDW